MEKDKNNIVNLKPHNKTYTSLSYQMVADLLNNKQTPLYIRLKLYFGILQRYGKKIFCLNKYLANKFGVSEYQVKYHLKKLKDEGTIKVLNEGTFKREIVLLEYIMLKDDDLTDEIKKKTEDLRQSAFGKFAVKENVYLTDEELLSIKELMGSEYARYINDLNTYINDTNRKYKSHYETLKAWWYKNQKAKSKKKKQEETPQFLDDDSNFVDYDWLNEDDDNTYLGSPIDDWLKDINSDLDDRGIY